MTLPTATYRLQFRNGMDFKSAIELIPYLSELGVSHLYASPVFTAVKGSAHGYDVTDANAIDPDLGGMKGFEAMAAALREAGLGLILDIVPNHMAASLQNAWWRDVVEWGQASTYASHFDIDWDERLTLPFLGDTFEAEAAAGKLRLTADRENGRLAMTYFEDSYPLSPATYPAMLKGLEGMPIAEKVSQASVAADPRDPQAFHARIRDILGDAATHGMLERELATLSSDMGFLESLHALQPWQLTSWKTASRRLSYRRFFEITGLVGLRVEERAVFDDAHRLVLDLVRRGLVDGLRVDHVDGLADPAAYLERLRREVGDDTFIVVEKILEKDEELPDDWPVSGTTGYEFITAVADVLVDPREDGRLRRAFQSLSGDTRPFADELRECKTLMLTENFAGEVERLAGPGAEIAEMAGNAIGTERLAAAIRGLIVEMPVYRTYATRDGASRADRELLERIARKAEPHVRDDGAVAFLLDIIERNIPGIDPDMLARFRARFQQLSGPVMAKALEDTLFYRDSAFLALNEVGGSPESRPAGVDGFHETMLARRLRAPQGLSATSTHDTKRGEDARARLYAISEAPDEWIAAVERWRTMNAHLVRPLADGPAPEPRVEWMVYQALAGVWPVEGPADRDVFDTLPSRMRPYMEKALREAKLRTNWSSPNTAYEKAAMDFTDGLLASDNREFLADFDRTLAPYVKAGLVNSLSQTLLKLMAPGIPDIYQGAGQLDFSLVDPDNRRPFSQTRLSEGGHAPEPDPGHIADYRHWLIRTCLTLRRQFPDLFRADYVPLTVAGEAAAHVLAFMRRGASASAIVIAPRLVFGQTSEGSLRLKPEFLKEARIEIPEGSGGADMHDVLSGKRFEAGRMLDAGAALDRHPVGLFLMR